MKTEQIPGVEEYANRFQDEVPHLVHRVCAVCVPEPHPGDKAVCGHEIQGCPARPQDYDCKVCKAKWPMHVLSHFGGRG